MFCTTWSSSPEDFDKIEPSNPNTLEIRSKMLFGFFDGKSLKANSDKRPIKIAAIAGKEIGIAPSIFCKVLTTAGVGTTTGIRVVVVLTARLRSATKIVAKISKRVFIVFPLEGFFPVRI